MSDTNTLDQTAMIDEVRIYFKGLQDVLCNTLSELEPRAKFKEDAWQPESGGEGITRIMRDGEVFEQAGVNFSHVRGKALPASASAKRPELAGASFEAMGVSLVIHPMNPYVPTTHMNVRFFIATPSNGPAVWWFGGGFDLTPYYGFSEDCIHWHQMAKNACDPFGEDLYPRYKQWCDDYFFIKHRNEARGVGGLFFDDVSSDDFARSFEFVKSVGNHFIPAYVPIVKKRVDHPFDVQQKAFQLYRRGRYVEFNLVYDRGTLFGLQSGGRVESILMSLPPQVIYTYDWQPNEGSAEAALYQSFLPAQDWLAKS